MITQWVVGVVSLFALSSCATQNTQEALLKEYRATTPVCSSRRQCDAMWAASERWILRNSVMKIEFLSDEVLKTFSPPRSSPLLGIKVTKKPITPDGHFQILIDTWCNNPFGCHSDFYEEALNFNRTVGPIRSNLPGVPTQL